MSTVAIVLARSGSKRLPGKNKLLLVGQPMISYTFQAAKSCLLIDKVVVSTDDVEIKTIAQKEGVEFLLRPDELSLDTTTSADAVLHVLKTLQERGEAYENFVLLQPTSPLRTAQHLTDCLTVFFSMSAKSTISVTEVSPHPRFFYHQVKGELLPLQGEHSLDDKVWAPNGAIYAMKVDDFKQLKKFNASPCLGFAMSNEESCDVDYYWQFSACEAILKRRLELPPNS